MKLNINTVKKLLIGCIGKDYDNTNLTIIRYHPKLSIFLLMLGQSQPDIRKRFQLWDVFNKFKEELKKERN